MEIILTEHGFFRNSIACARLILLQLVKGKTFWVLTDDEITGIVPEAITVMATGESLDNSLKGSKRDMGT